MPDGEQRSVALVTTTRSGGRSVALTFDDGPNPPDTLPLLDVLRRRARRPGG